VVNSQLSSDQDLWSSIVHVVHSLIKIMVGFSNTTIDLLCEDENVTTNRSR
jgi:hypothetical protein